MGDALSGGVMVAIAAALWIAYLVPSWLHRRQYLATERNAVRLQQTLRILAETAETPEAVRLETTARAVAAQEHVLREHQAAERARLKAEATIATETRRAAEREAAESVRLARAAAARSASAAGRARTRARAVRRNRALTSLGLLLSLIALVAGVVTGALGATWTLAVAGLGGTVVALFVLSSLAKAGRRVPVSVAAAPAAVSERFVPVEFADAAPVATRPAWTPRPLPKPLTLERGSVAAAAMDSVEEAAALRRAAVFAAMSEKAAAMNAGAPVPLRRAPAASAPAAERTAAPASASVPAVDSRFARMGIIDDAAPGMSDLDAVLRRRRVG
ncbi:hypothetical protein [Leifsonia sp. Leaf264]|uniref:hypothetical protein n=1 Tax=Leifsonia sp. Leaf264 TaxID=1736314 RepID=UPI0006F41617|nr:hypothetical protein [Leifsonia sp. Leaf264]KQP01726.1 hypothetical protein ASF30_03885 [Leifsonia sp. Leaf264]